MRNVTFAAGVGLATALICPLAALTLLVLITIHQGGSAVQTLQFLPIAIFVAFPIGMFVSTIPSVLGATAMAWLGTRQRWARHPLGWLCAGALAGLGLWGAFEGSTGRGALFFGLSGVTCALLCRRGTAWGD